MIWRINIDRLLFVSPLLLEQFPCVADRLRRFNFFMRTSKTKKNRIGKKISNQSYFEHVVIREYLVRVFVDYLVLCSIHFEDQLERKKINAMNEHKVYYQFHSPIVFLVNVHFQQSIRSYFWYEKNSMLLQHWAKLPMMMMLLLVHWSVKMYQSMLLKDQSVLLIDLIDKKNEKVIRIKIHH